MISHWLTQDPHTFAYSLVAQAPTHRGTPHRHHHSSAKSTNDEYWLRFNKPENFPLTYLQMSHTSKINFSIHISLCCGENILGKLKTLQPLYIYCDSFSNATPGKRVNCWRSRGTRCLGWRGARGRSFSGAPCPPCRAGCWHCSRRMDECCVLDLAACWVRETWGT